jgi:hypothetical protein
VELRVIWVVRESQLREKRVAEGGGTLIRRHLCRVCEEREIVCGPGPLLSVYSYIAPPELQRALRGRGKGGGGLGRRLSLGDRALATTSLAPWFFSGCRPCRASFATGQTAFYRDILPIPSRGLIRVRIGLDSGPEQDEVQNNSLANVPSSWAMRP